MCTNYVYSSLNSLIVSRFKTSPSPTSVYNQTKGISLPTLLEHFPLVPVKCSPGESDGISLSRCIIAGLFQKSLGYAELTVPFRALSFGLDSELI